jgi:uncharacterized membrane protein
MRLGVLTLHVLGVVVWLGGLAYQAHVILPTARREERPAIANALARGRPVAWTALAVVVLTGFYNITQLGPLDRLLASGAALWLAAKFFLVLVAVTLASHRDFAQLPRLTRALAAGADPTPTLRAITCLDRLLLLLGVVIIYLGLAVSRG